jgi:hypothetical protein
MRWATVAFLVLVGSSLASEPQGAPLSQVEGPDPKQQPIIAESIRNMGGRGRVERRGLITTTVEVTFSGQRAFTDQHVRILQRLPMLERLHLLTCVIRREGVERLGKLANLQLLDVSLCRGLGDAGLTHLQALTELRILNLSMTDISDRGIGDLQGMKRLERLYLNDTSVTDIALQSMKSMTRLQHLSLSDTQITDEGLREIKGMTNLRYLALSRSKVTDAGIDELQRALPKLIIKR